MIDGNRRTFEEGEGVGDYDDDFNDYHLHPDDMLFEIDDGTNKTNAGPKPKRKSKYLKSLREDDEEDYYDYDDYYYE